LNRIVVSLEFSDMGEGVVELAHWKNAGLVPNAPKLIGEITPVLLATYGKSTKRRVDHHGGVLS